MASSGLVHDYLCGVASKVVPHNVRHGLGIGRGS
jgi:hypothetical protein